MLTSLSVMFVFLMYIIGENQFAGVNDFIDLQKTPKDKKASLVIHGLVDKVTFI